MEGSFVGVNYQGENDNYISSNNSNSNCNNQAVLDEQQLNLPPGFRFHPTDEEIIIHYLIHKVFNSNFTATAIGEVDLNRCEPWDLPKKAKMGEKEWYFFCQRDRKYPTGMRTNRATESGYWKATGKDKEIYNKPAAGKGSGGSSRDGGGKQLVGMKKTLVFYKGRAPKGEKSDWVMHEFRLEGNFSYYKLPKSAKDEWVVCRVIHKNAMILKPSPTIDLTRMNSFVEGLLDSPSLPPLLDAAFFNTNEKANVSSSTNTGISSCNVQDFKETSLANKYPITTTLSPDGKPIYYHQLQMQPQTYSTSTTIFDPISTNYQIPNSVFYSQNPYELHQQKFDHLTIPNFPRPDNVKQNTNQALHERQCKAEQLSSNNQSMVSPSPDTGLSADITTDNASSKQEENREKRRRLNDIDEDNGPFSDLDSFWSY